MNTKYIRSAVVVLMSGLFLLNVLPTIALADNPVPATTSISPNFAVVGSPAFTMTVNGNNFVPGAFVSFNGSSRPTTYVSATQLNASISASDLNTVGTYNVMVTNPTPVGGNSNVQIFTVGNVPPTVNSISPSSIPSGSTGFTLTVTGSNFIPSSMVNFGGSARSTVYVSSTQLNAAITTADVSNPGAFNITVTNPGPGGGTSNAQVFSVTGTNPIATLNSISPSSATAGGSGFTLTLYGSNFTSNSMVRFRGFTRSTTFVSPTQLTAVILDGDIAFSGSYAVDVINSYPGGSPSNAVIFTVNPVTTTVTPRLPNTGFGPVNQVSGWATGVTVAGITVIGMLLTAFGIRRAWFTK